MTKSPYDNSMDVVCPVCKSPTLIANRLSDGVLIVKEHVIVQPDQPLHECPGGGRPIVGVPDF